MLIAALAALATVALARRSGRQITADTRIAFGPFLALGFWTVWVFGALQ